MQTGAQVADQAVQGILSRIDQLAVKLGTTAAHLWDIYVWQARVEAVRDGVLAIVGLVSAIIAARLIRFFWKKEAASESSDGWFGFLAFACGAITGAGIILFFLNFYAAIGEYLNPQYWAFQQLTRDLKNLF
jgi:hypothetical protein